MQPQSFGQTLTRVAFDAAVRIYFSAETGDSELTLYAPFLLVTATGERVEIDPAQLASSNLAAVVDLINRHVTEVRIHSDGTLKLRDPAGELVSVSADRDYESWVLETPGVTVYGLPDGRVDSSR